MVFPPTVLDPNQLDIRGPPEIKRLRWIVEPPNAAAAHPLGEGNMDGVLVAVHVLHRILYENFCLLITRVAVSLMDRSDVRKKAGLGRAREHVVLRKLERVTHDIIDGLGCISARFKLPKLRESPERCELTGSFSVNSAMPISQGSSSRMSLSSGRKPAGMGEVTTFLIGNGIGLPPSPPVMYGML